jgi:hypothetical protein
MSETAPEITTQCKKKLQSKDFSNIQTVIAHHEILVVTWHMKPTSDELNTVESIFQSISNRIYEKEVEGMEDQIEGYSFEGDYGYEYTTYYLSPQRISP